jgi:hypothetical protein
VLLVCTATSDEAIRVAAERMENKGVGMLVLVDKRAWRT